MLLMLSAAPVLWVGNPGLKLRDLVVEFSRWVLGPRVLYTVDHHRPLLVGKKGIFLITTDGPLWRVRFPIRKVGPSLWWLCVVCELAATGVAGRAVLRRSGWFDAGLIHSSAESLH